MKKVMFIMLTGIFLAVSLNSCREKKEESVLTEEEQLIQDMKDEGADVKYKETESGTKLKMETDDKKLKIKTDEDGNTTKVKMKDTSGDDN
jgi:hypothetical protein